MGSVCSQILIAIARVPFLPLLHHQSGKTIFDPSPVECKVLPAMHLVGELCFVC